jgi:hypothetical protein
MDPLTIVASSLGIAKLCVSVGWELQKFIDGTALVGTAINALVSDVKSFENILEQLKETFEDPKIEASLPLTGHIGSHWRDLQASLDDAAITLKELEGKVTWVNKDKSFLDTSRKHLRLKRATEEIAVYRHQIGSYKDTIYVSLQTTILYVHQSTDFLCFQSLMSIGGIKSRLKSLQIKFSQLWIDSLQLSELSV